MSYVFNGTAKTISLVGITVLDLIDLHSRWKDWVYSGNAGYLSAFKTVGGDIPAIPLYLFLINGWRVVPQSANHTLSVINGIFEVEGGGDPFVDPVGSFIIRINRQTPGIAIGYSSEGNPVVTGDISTISNKLSTLPTLSEIEASTLAKESTVLSRLADADYVAPDNAGIAAIPSASENATAILSAANIAPIASNVKRVNSANIVGTGTELDPWGPV